MQHVSGKPAVEEQGLRERKKQATRLHISNVATQLFIARGFDNVTVGEVADAANVSKMTVFNYFPRKEDLFFDRSEDIVDLLRRCLDARGRMSPVAALQRLAHNLVEEGHPITKISHDVAVFWNAVAESTSLRARALELLEQLEQQLGCMLASSVQLPPADPNAQLVAATVLAAWRVAFGEALRHRRSGSTAASRKMLLDLLDRGFAAAATAAKGTPYV